jgi:hypothetical protein
MVQSGRPNFRAVKTACTLLETTSAGEDRGDELCVGMASSAKVGDNRIDVERRAAVGHGQSVAVVLQEKPAGGAAGTGQSRAAGVEGTDAVNETIRGEMGVAADDDISPASCQQRSELLISDAGVDPWAVVGPG